jgi:hypothetical protein
MPHLNFTQRILAFSDVSHNSNPQRRLVDWSRLLLSIPISRPLNQVFDIEPLSEVLVFNGTRTLGYDGTSRFTLGLTPGTVDTYRLTWTGVGAAPVFRVDRAPNILNQSTGGTPSSLYGYISISPQPNQVVFVTNPDLSGDPLATWTTIQIGDQVFIPGITTGDEAIFDPMNEGPWIVLGVSSDHKQLTLGRTPGTVYSASTSIDTTNIDDVGEFLVFGSSGVQVGDTLDLISGFSSQALRAYDITCVTPTYIEFRSSLPLSSEAILPGVNSFNVYSSQKSFIHIETDQEIAVKLNGNTAETDRVTPILASEGNKVGVYSKFGTVYSLSLKNRSTSVATVTLISSE